jgi:hypothetical protein
VSRIIFLDTGPLGLVTQRKGVPGADACRQWVSACLDRGARVIVPAIADFEVRRELVRANKANSLARLDAFNAAEPDRYLVLSDVALRISRVIFCSSPALVATWIGFPRRCAQPITVRVPWQSSS